MKLAMKIIHYLEDCALSFLQGHCDHPDEMVASDVLEGCVDHLEVKYCRRCGAIKTDWSPNDPEHNFIILEHWWRKPDPHLWRDGNAISHIRNGFSKFRARRIDQLQGVKR